MVLIVISSKDIAAQTVAPVLPVEEFIPAQYSTKESIIYVSGDGGMNHFSTSLCKAFEALGYPVIAIDARSYFWKSKSPKIFAKDLAGLMQGYKKISSSFVLIGYSFGADVSAFMPRYLSGQITKFIRAVVLMNPGLSTDFEVTLTAMLGFEDTRGHYNIIDEINDNEAMKMMCLFSDKDKSVHKKISNEAIYVNILPGNHRFDDNVRLIASTIRKWF